MSKLYIMIPIISFWLFLPIGLQFMGYSEYERLDFKGIENIETPQKEDGFLSGIFNNSALTTLWTMVGFYMKTIFIWLDGAGTFINIILWIFRIISGFVILLAIRGTD